MGTAANNKNLTLDKFPNINGLTNILSVPDNYSKNTTINNASNQPQNPSDSSTKFINT
jgi:hypothetical protein